MSPVIVMKKPKNWNQLPLYEKVGLYQKSLNKFHSQFVDKLNAKIIVKNICKDDIEVPKVIKILKGPNDILETDIKDNYIIKASHGSKWNINIEKNKSYLIENIISQLEKWNQKYHPYQEKQYLYIKPRFFIEEKMNDKYDQQNGEAMVYMCRCIYGKVISISIKYKELRNDYDINWNIIGDHELGNIEKPVHYDLLIKNAEKLSSFFEFVRMDFYIDVDDKIYFSEFTFSPMGGMKVLPLHLEYELSKYWY
jgi:hypothetical protein